MRHDRSESPNELSPRENDVEKDQDAADLVNGDHGLLLRQVALVQDELVRTDPCEHESRVVPVPPRERRHGPFRDGDVGAVDFDLVQGPAAVVGVAGEHEPRLDGGQKKL